MTEETEHEFAIGMDVRAYGTVKISGATTEEAWAKLTAEYVADNFEPMGGGSDDFDMTEPLTICELDTGAEVPDGPWKKNPCGKIELTSVTIAHHDEEAGHPDQTFEVEAKADGVYVTCPEITDDGILPAQVWIEHGGPGAIKVHVYCPASDEPMSLKVDANNITVAT